MPRSWLLVPVAIVALPLFASTRDRAVRPLPMVTLTGVIRNASGNAVPGAVVVSGNSASNRNGTGSDGKYSITLPGYRPTTLTVSDFAYDTQSFVAVPVDGTTFDMTLTSPHAFVTVKMSNGDSHLLDVGTAQFAYLIPLSGYARSDTVNLCLPDGSSISPSKTDFSRIVGPGQSVNFGPCCSKGPTMMVTIQLKSGQNSAAYFNDACLGNEVDFVGRESATGLWQYLRFADIAEIDFP